MDGYELGGPSSSETSRKGRKNIYNGGCEDRQERTKAPHRKVYVAGRAVEGCWCFACSPRAHRAQRTRSASFHHKEDRRGARRRSFRACRRKVACPSGSVGSLGSESGSSFPAKSRWLFTKVIREEGIPSEVMPLVTFYETKPNFSEIFS